jgi:phage virion morphogenesis protein
MAGTALVYDFSSLSRLEDRLQRLAGTDRRQLLGELGAVLESQTKRRITDEKEGPDGASWADWSEGYAAKRHSGQSLLESEGHLEGEITHNVTSDSEVEVGTNLVYAATHQFGSDDGRNIPARPYLGLSADNEAELLDVADRFLDRVVNL